MYLQKSYDLDLKKKKSRIRITVENEIYLEKKPLVI